MYDAFDIDPFADVLVNPTSHIIKDVAQGSDEWKALRCGKITSSCVYLMMAKGEGLTRNKYMRHLAIERITGVPIEGGFKSKAMKKGNADEPLARADYEWINAVEAEQVTFVYHPSIQNAGASPDALIDEDGGIEIKCPDLQTHLEYLITKKVPTNYMWQIQWQLACTGRTWWDFVSYAKEMPENLRLLVVRVYRDEKMISDLEDQATKLNKEIEELISKLTGAKHVNNAYHTN